MALTATLTVAGISKENGFISGDPAVQISHFAVGDGGGSPVTYTETPTGLINECWRSTINRKYDSGGIPVFEVTVPYEVGGFWMRELSLIDSDGNEIAVAAIPESFKPDPASSGNSKVSIYHIAVQGVSVEFLTELIIDSSAVIATRNYVDTEINALPAAWPDAENLGGNPPNYFASDSSLQAAAAFLVPTGAELGFWGSVAPSGWVLASGRTIGNAASGGTERANDDTQSLFELLWNSTTDAELQIQDSNGAASTRGATAADDFAAGKRLPLPDMRGRVGVGKDTMGGIPANRMTSSGSGVDGTKVGSAGGQQTHTLSSAQMPTHNHGVNDPGHSHSVNDPGHNHGVNDPGHNHNVTDVNVVSVGSGGAMAAGINIAETSDTRTTTTKATGISLYGAYTSISVNGAGTGISTQSAGSGEAHNNTQPSIVRNVIIKL